jgi:hypothetical protein
MNLSGKPEGSEPTWPIPLRVAERPVNVMPVVSHSRSAISEVDFRPCFRSSLSWQCSPRGDSREHEDTIAFLREENRVLKVRLEGRRLRLDDHERRRLAELGHRLGRELLSVATLVTPETILRWHRELVARTWTYRSVRGSRAGLQARIRSLVLRMATDNPTWGYTRMQGALKHVGHHLGRSTIARILGAAGIPPSRQRPMAWRTFLQAHWPALVAGGLLHDRGLDRARTRDVLHGVRHRVAHPARLPAWFDTES